jgi:hypothetical protein
MRRFLLAGLLAGVGGLLSGCDILLVALWDATTPDPVQAVDVVRAKRPNFCGSLIHYDGRFAFPMQGDVRAPGYKATSIPLIWPTGGQTSRHASSLDLSTAPRVTVAGTIYVYVTQAIDDEEAAFLPPMPFASEFAAEDGGVSAWRSTLYRQAADGTLSRECIFFMRHRGAYFAM